MSDYKKLAFILLDVLLLALLGLYIFAGRKPVPFHGDESTFVWMSHDYYYLVQKHDDAPVLYTPNPIDGHAQCERVLNGSLNPLGIGLAWDLAGMNVSDLNSPWNWQHAPSQWILNINTGALPDTALLNVARIPSTLLTVLSVVVVFAIARQVVGVRGWRSRAAAWLACLIYATSPAVLVNGRRAMQEGGLLFFSALVMLIALFTLRAQARPGASPRTVLPWMLALAAVSGAAVASKHTAAVVVAAAYLAVLVAPLFWRDTSGLPFDRRHVRALTGSGVLAIVVFFLLVPTWWSWPHQLALSGLGLLLIAFSFAGNRLLVWIARGSAAAMIVVAMVAVPAVWGELLSIPASILKMRSVLMDIQADIYGDQNALGKRAVSLLDETFFADVQYYEDPFWADFDPITEQIKAYESAGLQGRGGGLIWGVPLILLTAAGLFGLTLRWREGASVLIACWLLVVIVALLANPLPWQRYYLIVHGPLAVIAGLGLATITTLLREGKLFKLGGIQIPLENKA